MRKALIGLIMAATVMTPIAAQAQEEHHGRGDRAGRSERRQNESGESRAARIEQRQERREARQEPQVQPQVQQQPTVQVVQRQRGDDGNRGDRGSRGDWNRGDRGDRGGRGDRTNQGSIYPQAWQGNPNDPQLRHYQDLERRNQRRGDTLEGRRDRRDDRRDWRGDRRDDRRDWRGDNRRGDWNRGWRNDRRYDWSNWRNRNHNIFHISPYYSPYRNHRYSRFSIGIILDSLFFNQRYWLSDPWQYRLPPAPYGTQWVRYYDDVLLVDVYTGEVIDAIYDFFW